MKQEFRADSRGTFQGKVVKTIFHFRKPEIGKLLYKGKVKILPGQEEEEELEALEAEKEALEAAEGETAEGTETAEAAQTEAE